MENYTMGAVESRFADLIWESEPLTSGDLVKLSEKALKWKKSTTYTVLKKLCNKGIFQNENSIVTSRVTRNQYYARQSKQFIQDTFGGSLPMFLTAFAAEEKLSESEIEALQKLIAKSKDD
ncbi:MAG: BlaI/MecI/CopY family transcriptional regulator [Clostridiales bacterium]|jgi:BlaI family penicillinase repressor|nr:BlaI/MecI/CopY family transcriptional regulator [Clostridiales bacterium]